MRWLKVRGIKEVNWLIEHKDSLGVLVQANVPLAGYDHSGTHLETKPTNDYN